MSEQIRYSISDELKKLMSGENETVFRMMENRFCVDIQSRLSGLILVTRDKDSDLQAALACLDQVKLAAKNGTPITRKWLERLTETESISPESEKFLIPTVPILRNRYGIRLFPKQLPRRKWSMP
jgi:phosphate starvation-inducible PhoH-like protein